MIVTLIGFFEPEISPLQLLNNQSFSGIALSSIIDPLEYGLEPPDWTTDCETDPDPLIFNLKLYVFLIKLAVRFY